MLRIGIYLEGTINSYDPRLLCIECLIRNDCLKLLRKIDKYYRDEMDLSNAFMQCLIKCKVDGFKGKIKSSIIFSHLQIFDQNDKILLGFFSQIFQINDIRIVKIISHTCLQFYIIGDPTVASPIKTRIFLCKLYERDIKICKDDNRVGLFCLKHRRVEGVVTFNPVDDFIKESRIVYNLTTKIASSFISANLSRLALYF